MNYAFKTRKLICSGLKSLKFMLVTSGLILFSGIVLALLLKA